MGLELPGLTASEPAYAHCLDWLLCEALADLHRADGRAHYLRLSTRPVDQGPLSAAQDRMGTERLRDDVLKGAYVLRTPGFSEGAALTMLASGPVSPRCWRRPSNSRREGMAVTVIDVTSLYRECPGTWSSCSSVLVQKSPL